jgi:hypothetical protein
LTKRVLIISLFLYGLTLIALPPEERGYDETRLEEWNASKDFDYERDIPPPNNLLSRVLRQIGQAIGWIFSHVTGYIILAGLLALLVWVVLKNTSSEAWHLRKKQKSPDGLQVRTREELEQEDFLSLAQEAFAKKQFRLAIRYQFLAALRHLQLQKYIDWHIEKTNYEYLSELPGELHNSYLALLRIYEYVWYGEFQADENLFNRSRTHLQDLEERREPS